MKVVLYQPEIPPNTGNIIRLSANTGLDLDIIEPMGFVWDDKRVSRAGLDYHDLTKVQRFANWDQWIEANPNVRILAFTTKGSTRYDQIQYTQKDALLFGPETRGLPDIILNALSNDQKAIIPMHSSSRSLNLSNSVAIAVYEALRQSDFSF